MTSPRVPASGRFAQFFCASLCLLVAIPHCQRPRAVPELAKPESRLNTPFPNSALRIPHSALELFWNLGLVASLGLGRLEFGASLCTPLGELIFLLNVP